MKELFPMWPYKCLYSIRSFYDFEKRPFRNSFLLLVASRGEKSITLGAERTKNESGDFGINMLWRY